ncbi:MAG: trypsin-like peptidase domain-containing protein [Dehalococcoidia bacterium]|nr:trypsin-like peptidase domain-containing protein [Dehalococcoidia bacterium]
MKRLTGILAVVVLSVIVGAAAVIGINSARGNGNSATTVTVAQATPNSGQQVSANSSSSSSTTTQTNGDFTSLYTSTRPSIVEITTGTQGSNAFSQQAEGLGSGIVLDTNGNILTNYHVVSGSNSVTITFADGTVSQADVVGKDPGNDMAVVKTSVDKSELKPAKLGNSDNVQIGNVVFAIGNPFGLEGSFTTGVISGLNRTLASGNNGRPLRNLLQTDAAVNPGNSGGALFDLQGQVIGINTAIENPGGNTFAGIAYAIPINTPKRYMQQLLNGATITHPRLGISGSTLSPSDAKSIGVSYGVAVVNVDPGSSAEQAGLQPSSNGNGDVITAIDGKTMKTFEGLANYIDQKNVGDKVTLTVRRGGKDLKLTATLQAWNSAA